MDIDEHREVDRDDFPSIKQFIKNLESSDKELVLLNEGKVIGAILTTEQYEWFLDQIDAQQDLGFADDRANDLAGAQTLEDFKKEL